MRSLVLANVRPLAYRPKNVEDQRDLQQAFATAGIRVQITSATFLDDQKVWVEEKDFERAAEIVVALERRRAAIEKDRYEKEWDVKYGRSFRSWCLTKAKSPEFWIAMLVAGALVFVFAIYPMWTVIRR